MNPLDRSLLESLGDDNGWENLFESSEDWHRDHVFGRSETAPERAEG